MRWTMYVSAGLLATALAVPGQSMAAPEPSATGGPDAQTRAVAAYWTPERQRAAVSRDIVVDAQGRSYLRAASGRLEPYGNGKLVARPTLEAVGGGPAKAAQPVPLATADTTGPSITGRSPMDGVTISSTSVTFTATVTDSSGVKSVTVKLIYPDGRTGSFSATGSGTTWSVTLQNFTAGSWKWQLIAKDTVRGGNTTTSPQWGFTVAPGGGGTPSGDVASAQWTTVSPVLNASGRLIFEMPANQARTRWSAYVCSATVVSDGGTGDGRSMLLTAAHCVYDDAHKTFARNVLFIPDQEWSGTSTDRICSNDKYGCWAPSAGIVDADWTTRAWPDNIPWDYGYYVVANTGSHIAGTSTSTLPSLEAAVTTPMTAYFGNPLKNRTSAFGYSYSQDPKLMYCAQARGYTGGSGASASDNWWLSQCGLSGGASGGPWLDEDPVSGTGQILSVNSWGYQNTPGMAGPKLNTSSSTTRLRAPLCVYRVAKNLSGSLLNTTASTCPAS